LNRWWVYIIEKNSRLYVGISVDLSKRLRQHNNAELLYREGPYSRDDAVQREKMLKGWRREKKLDLISRASSRIR
jgi:putative endonuclease